MKPSRLNRQEIRTRLTGLMSPRRESGPEPAETTEPTAADVKDALENINQDITELLLDEILLKSRDRDFGKQISRLKTERQQVKNDLKRVGAELANRQKQISDWQRIGQAILADCQDGTAVEALLADNQPEQTLDEA